ncbi:MAG TPA: GNAT family N-acetyltransferase [Jatrophihabitantaceae bacterium]
MVTVRAAVEADVEAIREVGHQTWPPTYGPIAGDDYVAKGLAQWWSADAVLESVRGGGVLVAEADGEIVGMASFSQLDGQPYLWKLYVRPDRQGLGAGSALLTAVLDALPAGSTRLGLDYVDGNDSANAFYRAKGFVPIGRKPSPLADGPDEILMELRLPA